MKKNYFNFTKKLSKNPYISFVITDKKITQLHKFSPKNELRKLSDNKEILTLVGLEKHIQKGEK